VSGHVSAAPKKRTKHAHGGLVLQGLYVVVRGLDAVGV
jgi:hypothetical protein